MGWLSSLEVVFPGGRLPNFQNCFDVYWSRPTNVSVHIDTRCGSIQDLPEVAVLWPVHIDNRCDSIKDLHEKVWLWPVQCT